MSSLPTHTGLKTEILYFPIMPVLNNKTETFKTAVTGNRSSSKI